MTAEQLSGRKSQPREQITERKQLALRVQGDSLNAVIFRNADEPLNAGELAVRAVASLIINIP